MVEVRITKNKSEIVIEMIGHSKFGRKGSDIVCAGISAVFQFMITHLFNTLKMEGSFELTSGKGYIKVRRTEEAEKIINSYEQFIRLLDKSYPNTIKIEI